MGSDPLFLVTFSFRVLVPLTCLLIILIFLTLKAQFQTEALPLREKSI